MTHEFTGTLPAHDWHTLPKKWSKKRPHLGLSDARNDLQFRTQKSPAHDRHTTDTTGMFLSKPIIITANHYLNCWRISFTRFLSVPFIFRKVNPKKDGNLAEMIPAVHSLNIDFFTCKTAIL
jgi:hypothetical protein